jgi:hypothetical protein
MKPMVSSAGAGKLQVIQVPLSLRRLDNVGWLKTASPMLSGSKGLIRSTAGGTDFANAFGKAHSADVSYLGENKAGRKVPGPYLRCPPWFCRRVQNPA